MSEPQKKGEKEGDEPQAISPFAGMQKSTVLQEARIFHDTQLSGSKCVAVLTKLLYLVNQGEKLTTAEATEVFFATTKLFQSKDVTLRRIVYVVIKELTKVAEDVIIITSCLMKDINSKNDLYKANAIRVLCGVTDNTMVGQIERYIKQAIVDKGAYVASAGLVSAIHLMKTSKDVVRRWVNEVQEALNSKLPMVQYHALGLLYKIKQGDRLALSRLVQSLARSGNLKSPFAHCLLIRFASQVLAEEETMDRALYEYLDSCTRHKADMVLLEAARAMCGIRNITARDLQPAITVLQLFVGSSKTVLKYAAVRTLSQVAMTHPLSVVQCNQDLENLISDSNRSVATLAITTLLKTGTEASVDRLMKSITEFMGEIPDEFKVVVVDAMRALCLKYPNKHRSLMAFLAAILRDEGGYEFKKAIVDAMVTLISSIPEARSTGLSHLCEFIEDCEYTLLAARVLYLLGEDGPRTPNPGRYIRTIFNRCLLESAAVRAAAVSTLARFGFACGPSSPTNLRPSIVVLLKRCMCDDDDEVRDRVALALGLLDRPDSVVDASAEADLLFKPRALSLEGVEQALLQYQSQPPSVEPFRLDSVAPPAAPPPTAAAPGTAALGGGGAGAAAAAGGGGEAPQARYTAQLAAVPELAGLGRCYKSSKPVELTEQETEYAVTAVKHVFPSHIVFQFNITNTIDTQSLYNVTVKMELQKDDSGDDFIEESVVAAPEIKYGTPGVSYVCMRLPEGAYPTPTFGCTLKFLVKDVDASSGKPDPDDEGYDDEYEIMEIEVSTADYIQRTFVANFADAWEKLGADNELVEVFSLTTMKTVQDAVTAISDLLGMAVLESSSLVKAGATSHTLLMAGSFASTIPVMTRVRFKLDTNNTVTMEFGVRSTVDLVSQAIAAAVG